MTTHTDRNIRFRAIAFTKDEIMRADDWQQVQEALANHPEFGPWLGDDVSECQNLIRDAEMSLGAKIPAGYSN